MEDNPVYWDNQKKQFYWIEWEETGNSDIPTRHYISDGDLLFKIQQLEKRVNFLEITRDDL